jgi:hypothetical protein
MNQLKLAVLGAAFAAIVSSSNAQQEPMGAQELGMMGRVGDSCSLAISTKTNDRSKAHNTA